MAQAVAKETRTRAESTGSGWLQLAKASFKDFSTHQCTVRAAALSDFTDYPLPPVVVLLIMAAGLVWNPESVQRALESQFAGLVGSAGGSEVRQMIVGGQRMGQGWIHTVLGFAGLIAGATG